MNGGVPYLPHIGEVTFREPFPTIRYEPMRTIYIRATVNGISYSTSEQQFRTRSRSNLKTIEREIAVYGKILNARAKFKKGKLEFIAHSPQSDFLNLVRSR